MKPKWQKLASLAQEMCTLWCQFFGAVFASKGYPYFTVTVQNKTQKSVRAGKKTHQQQTFYSPLLNCCQHFNNKKCFLFSVVRWAPIMMISAFAFALRS